MTGGLEEVARHVLPLIDLTSLNDARDDDVVALCAQATTPAGPVAAVCVWPRFVAAAMRELAGTDIPVASVINFPAGGTDEVAVVAETEQALFDGARELDLVMPYQAWLAGERETACSLMAAVKAVAQGHARLKVILESGALGPAETIAAASRDAIAAGADFLKTSTGKRQPGATLEAARTMLEVICEAGGEVGFKASGGIRTTAQAGEYLALADRIMGPDWATSRSFRFGASSLLNDVLAHLGHEQSETKNSKY